MYIVFPLGKWGNESDGVVEVCLFPWSKDTLPTIEDIITLFNFHPKLSEKPMVDTSHKSMMMMMMMIMMMMMMMC